MRKQSNLYIFGFAIAVCLFASVVLAVASTALKPAQTQQVRLDIIENILSVAGIPLEDLKKKKPAEVISIYEKQFEVSLFEVFLEDEAGNRVARKKIEDLLGPTLEDPHEVEHLKLTELLELYRKKYDSLPESGRPGPLTIGNSPVQRSELEKELDSLGYKEKELADMMTFELLGVYNSKLGLLARRAGKTREEYDRGIKVVYLYKPEGEVKYYIIPIEGNGLWDMMYGYLALQTDLNTVAGIRFYKHSETPGLGAELAKPEHNELWIGKKILNEKGELVSVQVAKGSAEQTHPNELEHYVDGVSGATLTGKGINHFLKEDLEAYEPYFETKRKDQVQNQPAGEQQ